MIRLIHGEDIVKSREFFLQLVKKKEGVVLDGATCVLSDFIQIIEGASLFADTKTVYIEEFFSKRKQSKESDAIIAYINAQNLADIFFWESKELSVKQVHRLKGATVTVFKIPPTIFAFLDSIKPGNAKQSIVLLRQTLVDSQEQFLLFMLTRHIRMLLTFSDVASPISEVSRLAPWQKGKMEKQAATVGTNTLRNIHAKLYELDLAQKTGMLIEPLQSALEHLLILYLC